MTEQDFYKLSMAGCMSYCWRKYRANEFTEEQYDRLMKSWWRKNQSKQVDILTDIKEFFGEITLLDD